MIALETRTFEQRFGRRCPFCGAPWSSEKSCGGPKDWTIQQSLKMLFADRTSECKFCARVIPGSRVVCFDCARDRQKALNRENVRAYRERNQIEKTCQHCGTQFSTHKKDQRFCSLSCGNKWRHANVV